MVEEMLERPIYQKIAIDITNRIIKDEFALGTKIYGRSKLAGEYKVSPETIRRSMILLEDMNIVEVNQGSGITVKSRDQAYKYIEKFKVFDSINSLKNDLINLNKEKKIIDDKFELTINKILDLSQKFKSTNPFSPLEIKLSKDAKIINKSISDVKFWKNTGATIVGIRRKNKMILSPGPDAIFLPDDVIVIIAEDSVYDRINEFLYG
jgi:K+/H+ antiporter YhaU regulatory subunit KhtT